MSKPVEISRKEYLAICKALEKKAKELVRGSDHSRAMLFSYSDITCVYREPPKAFKWKEPDGVTTCHFLPVLCDSVGAKMDSPVEAICLAKVGRGNKYRYYLDTHRIGRCSWKTRGEED